MSVIFKNDRNNNFNVLRWHDEHQTWMSIIIALKSVYIARERKTNNAVIIFERWTGL